MAAYLNRTISMVTGNNGYGENGANSLTDPNTRLLHTGHDTSPLQIFVRAKKRINDIFVEIEDYVVETTTFIDGKAAFLMQFFQILGRIENSISFL